MRKLLNYIWLYLKDWRNLLAHSLIGVLILSVAFFIPVEPIYRISLLILIVGFNILRMRYSKRKQKKES
jgi:hypothetical protein